MDTSWFHFFRVRLWRKTRTPGTICDGVDANRNFDSFWNVIGASSWQCDETYAGHVVFSEAESQVIRDYTLANKENIKLFLSIHSYGLWMLYPWGHITDEPENSEELRNLGELFREAVFAVRGTNYRVGTTANLLYYAAGITIDWARVGAGINLSYTIELPGGGNAGFNPPATSIEPIVTETWEGLKALYNYIQANYVDNYS